MQDLKSIIDMADYVAHTIAESMDCFDMSSSEQYEAK